MSRNAYVAWRDLVAERAARPPGDAATLGTMPREEYAARRRALSDAPTWEVLATPLKATPEQLGLAAVEARLHRELYGQADARWLDEAVQHEAVQRLADPLAGVRAVAARHLPEEAR